MKKSNSNIKVLHFLKENGFDYICIARKKKIVFDSPSLMKVPYFSSLF